MRQLRCRCGLGPLNLDPVNVGRCANFACSGLFAVLPISEASDYGTDSGLYRYADCAYLAIGSLYAWTPRAYPVHYTFKKWVR